jgi:hypothetical protein
MGSTGRRRRYLHSTAKVYSRLFLHQMQMAQAAERKNKQAGGIMQTHTLWVGTVIDTENSETHSYAGWSSDEIYEELYQYVGQYWADYFDFGTPMPEDRRTAVGMYFDNVCDYEYYHVQQLRIRDPSEPLPLPPRVNTSPEGDALNRLPSGRAQEPAVTVFPASPAVQRLVERQLRQTSIADFTARYTPEYTPAQLRTPGRTGVTGLTGRTVPLGQAEVTGFAPAAMPPTPAREVGLVASAWEPLVEAEVTDPNDG